MVWSGILPHASKKKKKTFYFLIYLLIYFLLYFASDQRCLDLVTREDVGGIRLYPSVY